MSNVQTTATREPQDLGHLVFTAGKIGRLQTLSQVPVIAGDSFEQKLIGSIRLSPLRRGLAVDSVLDVFSFYVPHRHVYGGEVWADFMEKGISSNPLAMYDSISAVNTGKLSFLGINNAGASSGRQNLPLWSYQGYKNIYDNYFQVPWTRGDQHPNSELPITCELFMNTNGEMAKYGAACAHLKSIWSTPLPSFRDDGQKTAPIVGSSIDLMALNQEYGKLHTQQERDLFMSRYRDIMKSFGGSTHYDADNRPHLLMRSTTWASGYDVDGTTEVTLGQHTGRVMQSFKHEVPRFFVPEHGTIHTVAVLRFPTSHQLENHYLMNNPAVDYATMAGDPSIVANTPPVKLRAVDVFDTDSTASLGDIAHSQWYRYHPDLIHSDYNDLQGYPFLKLIPVAQQTQLYINTQQYDGMFQTDQLGHWNMQAKNNITVLRNLPTVRDTALTNN